MKFNSRTIVRAGLIAVLSILTISAAVREPETSSSLPTQEELKQESKSNMSTNILPIVVWHSIRQGGSSSYSGGSYSSRNNYGGGSSYGK